MGGIICVESELGEGSKFIFRLLLIFVIVLKVEVEGKFL